jgi:SEC-C motif-containing protein
MRSRYAAYVMKDVGYLMRTHDPDTIDSVDCEGTADWARDSEWLGLEILSTERGGPGDDDGIVEFVASYNLDGEIHTHHERSRFRRREKEWVYSDGDMVKARPVVREGPKVGRNDPCPCGSGKKHKKCCGRLAS